MVNCGALVMEEDNTEFDSFKHECDRVALVPYQGEKESFIEMLRSGVLLSWVATNYSDCVDRGGQCGYSQSLSSFQCYCSDNPRSA